MNVGRLTLQYIQWHYTTAFADLWRVFTNFLWSVSNLFSISFLLKGLFDPFKRIKEEPRADSDLEMFFSALIVNTVMRLVGALLRLFVVIIGAATLLVTLLLGVCAFLLWPFIPFVVLALFALSVSVLV